MALSIYNNVYSLTAQKGLAVASAAQGKSLERLSSGLRINSAADDASGLAISEKLRGQISGLKRASMNAQDGISYLQTAEGGMEEVTNMLQRMRELAVQAGNGTYTTNDRAMLQLEVDQLKEEINRLSSSTEFNTKKLLNGDATALWSTDQDFIGALVRGPSVAEGNYKIETTMDPGTNTKYKTDIMSVKNGVLVSEVRDNTGTNLASVRNPNNLPITGSAGLTITVTGAATASVASAKTTATFKQDGSNWLVHNETSAATYSGYYEVEFTNGGIMTANTTAPLTYKYRVMDAKTGKLSEWRVGTATVAGASAQITLNASMTGGNTAVTINMPYGSDFKLGDKILGNFSPAIAADATLLTSGGGTVVVGDGPKILYNKPGELTKADNGNFKDDYNNIKVNLANMDPKTGIINYGDITMEFLEGAQDANATPGAGTTVVGAATLNVRDSGVATKDTKLSDIGVFTNADGVSILANTQELTIYGNGKSATIYLESDDTVEDFINKMNSALIDKLDMGADDMTADGKKVNNNLVNYVPATGTTENSAESVPGTFLMQTAKIGRDSDLVFIGDQGLLNALSLATIQEGKNSSMDVRVTDAHTGKFVGSDVVGDGRVRGLIDGLDITLSQNAGIDPVWNSSSKTLEFNASAKQASGYLHVVDNRTELQIGANQGQIMNVSVGQLDTTGLEIDDVYIMDMDLSQKAITKLDKAIQLVNESRATIGAQINRLDYTISNLQTAGENLTAAESRIRDLDMAEETSNLTKNQILVQAATAMVAQANQVPQQALTLLKG